MGKVVDRKGEGERTEERGGTKKGKRKELEEGGRGSYWALKCCGFWSEVSPRELRL